MPKEFDHGSSVFERSRLRASPVRSSPSLLVVALQRTFAKRSGVADSTGIDDNQRRPAVDNLHAPSDFGTVEDAIEAAVPAPAQAAPRHLD